ncbi:MAG: GNAT family N-acetyltransferase [Myxococcota bacterium]
MDEDVKVRKEDSPSGGRYVATVRGIDGQGEMTYSAAGATMWIVDHTAVDDALRGRGIGVVLANAMVEDARAAGIKLMPLCPFFRSQIPKHEEWWDVLDNPPRR